MPTDRAPPRRLRRLPQALEVLRMSVDTLWISRRPSAVPEAVLSASPAAGLVAATVERIGDILEQLCPAQVTDGGPIE